MDRAPGQNEGALRLALQLDQLALRLGPCVLLSLLTPLTSWRELIFQ
jgi:hypothetical protein